ncbi:hypothetical protein [Rubellimicrobium roseum]|uniref:Uncharacterized protein n=1 Tax=Rubellimicrobium roseum TaxID=687525 RepID=A0A5C4NID0_9RHOB|nr:hypothetical protein [Rubellimicrobium roseum]TNC72447.1 hypothetical protein FHG71_08665 [Rubellimicrobium roseum]
MAFAAITDTDAARPPTLGLYAMNPLTTVLAMLAATVATGPFLVAAFALGLYGWPSVLIALGLGGFAALALAWRIEAEIKRQDPAWDERRDCARPFAPVRTRVDDRRDRFDPRHHWRR